MLVSQCVVSCSTLFVKSDKADPTCLFVPWFKKPCSKCLKSFHCHFSQEVFEMMDSEYRAVAFDAGLTVHLQSPPISPQAI